MNYKLSDLVDKQNIIDFCKCLFLNTGINCCVINLDGTVFLPYQDSQTFSNEVLGSLNVLSTTISNNHKVVSDLQNGKNYIYSTYYPDLTLIAVPISINSEYIATLYCAIYNNSLSLLNCKHPKDIDNLINLLISLSKIIENIAANHDDILRYSKKLSSNYNNLADAYKELVLIEEQLTTKTSELTKTQKSLEQSEERYKFALIGSHDNIWDWDITNDRYTYSKMWISTLGYPQKDIPTDSTALKSLIHPDDLEDYNNSVNKYLNRVDSIYKCEYRIKKYDNSYIWIRSEGSATWNEDNIPIHMVGFYLDITQNKELIDKVHKMAYYDSLTGLPNRLSLCETLDSLCKNNNYFSIVFLDLDNFKSINETLGHNYGDRFLKCLTHSFSNILDEDSSVYRWDGDEFIFIFKNVTSETSLCIFIDKLIDLLNNPVTVNEHELYITGSLGGCIYPLHGKSTEEIIRNSDIAMNQAKSLGKNTYQIYNASFSAKALEQIKLDRALRHALKNNEFQVYYQPRIDISTNKLVGMEALIRWVKPDGTIVPPCDFIYKAEESGLIVPIGEFVIKTVCEKIKEWLDRGHDLTVSLNLSPYQINDKNLIRVIRDSIFQNRIPPSNIEFEITESAAINDMEHTIELLNELNSLGIKVLLDDFGTGYSSLNFLRLLPVSTIKIDKSFIDKVCEESTEKTIVCYLISLAHSISLRVIAEGIENTSQLCFLQDNLCDEAQGYYFSKPVSADDFENLLS